jgi:hypothetical protein
MAEGSHLFMYSQPLEQPSLIRRSADIHIQNRRQSGTHMPSPSPWGSTCEIAAAEVLID